MSILKARTSVFNARNGRRQDASFVRILSSPRGWEASKLPRYGSPDPGVIAIWVLQSTGDARVFNEGNILMETQASGGGVEGC
jgi:hypothetical protein